MAERGLTVSFETASVVLQGWMRTFKRLRQCRGSAGGTWHLDEVYLKINGQFQYLWRAVDQEGQVIDILVQNRRDSIAAE
jgi:putative transposase